MTSGNGAADDRALPWRYRIVQCLRGLGRGFLLPLLLTLLPAAPLRADAVYYIFKFQTQSEGQPVPTGGFSYDSTTDTFSNFIVNLNGTAFDFTAAANALGGHTGLYYELGFLADNLIAGYGLAGPDYSKWCASPDGFWGFEWSLPPIPGFPVLSDNLTPTGRSNSLPGTPGIYEGTWTTTVAAAVPEPASFSLMLTAMAAGALALRRRG